MYIYCELNENNICIGICQLSGEKHQENLMKVESFDSNYLWKKYDKETQKWSEEKFEPTSTAPLNEFEKLKQQNETLQKSILELSMMLGGNV